LKVSTLLSTALVFAIIQAGLLFIGWVFGELLAGVVHTISHIIAFALLAYVGGSMLIDGIKAYKGHDTHAQDLGSLKKIIIAGIATSIDAAAVGISQSVIGVDFKGFTPLFIAVFVITFISVVLGMTGGKKLGENFGHWAEIGGGLILLFLAVRSLFL